MTVETDSLHAIVAPRPAETTPRRPKQAAGFEANTPLGWFLVIPISFSLVLLLTCWVALTAH
jgi:hypothetical protein